RRVPSFDSLLRICALRSGVIIVRRSARRIAVVRGRQAAPGRAAAALAGARARRAVRIVGDSGESSRNGFAYALRARMRLPGGRAMSTAEGDFGHAKSHKNG